MKSKIYYTSIVSSENAKRHLWGSRGISVWNHSYLKLLFHFFFLSLWLSFFLDNKYGNAFFWKKPLYISLLVHFQRETHQNVFFQWVLVFYSDLSDSQTFLFKMKMLSKNRNLLFFIPKDKCQFHMDHSKGKWEKLYTG